jgi:hypothetical protein
LASFSSNLPRGLEINQQEGKKQNMTRANQRKKKRTSLVNSFDVEAAGLSALILWRDQLAYQFTIWQGYLVK